MSGESFRDEIWRVRAADVSPGSGGSSKKQAPKDDAAVSAGV